MEIYTVRLGDTIDAIAKKYGVTVEKLLRDNGLNSSDNIIIGQSLIITYPKQTYIVQKGDTLKSIADINGVTIMQLLRNNTFLSERKNIYPGETLEISYETSGKITTNGFCYPFIKQNTLVKTLPNLTYLSIFNYNTSQQGEIITFQDDADIVKTTKAYGVIPLMVITTLTSIGKEDVELSYKILKSKNLQERYIDQLVNILRDKGYMGANLIFNYLNYENEEFYFEMTKRISNRLKQEGFFLFLTINYDIFFGNNQIFLTKINFGKFSKFVNGFIFNKFVWGANYGPPAPISNINYDKELLNYVLANISPSQVTIGKPLIGYDWSLPYEGNGTFANALSTEAVLQIAYDTDSTIQFSEILKSPYFYYNQQCYGSVKEHVIWFVDVRSLEALGKVITNNNLYGIGIWNIMNYNSQLWTFINSKFGIVKYLS